MNAAPNPPVLTAGLAATLPENGQGGAFLSALVAGVSGAFAPEGLDAAMGDRPAPRVWLVMHRPGQEDLSAQVAAALAVACAGRGQAVVVVDADEDESRLTERVGSSDKEGLVDMARYGASLAAAGVPLPLPLVGGRGTFVGVGSFTPTETTDAELERLLARLRHQADDIILVAPCGAPSRRLARLTDLRLLCWDRSADRPQVWALAAQDLERSGRPVTTLVAVGAPVAAAAEPVAAPAPAPPPAPAPAVASAPAPTAAAPTPMAGRKGGPRRSSGIFWVAALAVVALISVVGIYNWQSIGPAPQNSGPQPGPTTAEPQGTQVPDSGSTLPTAGGQRPDSNAVGGETGPISELAVEPAVEPAAGLAVFERAAFTRPVGQDGWALHLYSLPDSAGALQMAAELESRGLATLIRPADLPSGRWYRVCVGSFPTRAAAAAQIPALLQAVREDWANPVRF